MEQQAHPARRLRRGAALALAATLLAGCVAYPAEVGYAPPAAPVYAAPAYGYYAPPVVVGGGWYGGGGWHGHGWGGHRWHGGGHWR